MVVMWILSFGMLVTLTYGLYPYNKDMSVMSPPWLFDLHAASCRFLWGLACAWIAYACLTGWGGTSSS